MNYTGGSNTIKWNTFTHNGVLFPNDYIQHYTPLIYQNQKIILNKEAEEYATLYVKYLDTEYIKNKRFNNNFWNDWKQMIKNDKITNFNDCNWSLIKDYYQSTKMKQYIENDEIYKYAIVNGNKIKVSNYKIEPPGIFIGRGDHPKLGCIKKRIEHEDVIINIDQKSQVPKPKDGHQWKNIIHDNTSLWLASWKDIITDKMKYVWLADKTDSDISKYETARKLKKKINKLKQIILDDLSNKDDKIKQIATCIYLIDLLALRVGNEKKEDETDTYGITSLLVNHVKLNNDNVIVFDFLGKDSVRYHNKIKILDQVYNNMYEFMKGKKNNENIFDIITSNDINKYLKQFMPDLTAKVFRTYNASNIFQNELNKIYKKYKDYDGKDKINIVINEINKANIKVAEVCNHQKNISKNYHETLNKIDDKINKLKENKQTESIKNKIKKYKILKEHKIALKNLSLTTSKMNYIDPRISISFLKKMNIDLKYFLTKTQLEKYNWALDVDENFEF